MPTLALLTPQQHYARLQAGVGFGLGDVPQDAVQVSTTPEQNSVWAEFLSTTADEMELASNAAMTWYGAMRSQFAELDIPLLQTAASEYGLPTVWTQELDQKLADLLAMSDQVIAWLREAASGQRPLVVQGEEWGISSKSTDPFSINMDNTVSPPMPAMFAGGSVLHQGATGLGAGPLIVGGVAIPWIIVGIGLVGSIAIRGLILYVVYAAVRGITDVLKGIINYWNGKTWADCVQKSSDPTLCTKALDGMKNLQEAENAARPPTPGEDIAKGLAALSDAAKAVLWVVLAGGAAYLAVKYGPAAVEWASERMGDGKNARTVPPTPAPAAHAANPVHVALEPGYAYVLSSSKGWRSAPDEDWDTEVIDELEIGGSKRVGTRSIDGHPVAVFEGGDGRFYAQT